MDEGAPFSVRERISSTTPPPVPAGGGILGGAGTSTGRGVSSGTGSDLQEPDPRINKKNAGSRKKKPLPRKKLRV